MDFLKVRHTKVEEHFYSGLSVDAMYGNDSENELPLSSQTAELPSFL